MESSPQERECLEVELHARHARGDHAAAATLIVRAYGPEILGLLVAVLRDEVAAADVFSQFCEDLWRGLPAFRRHASFRTWAYALARNAAHRHRRDPLRRRGVPITDCPQLEELEQRMRTTTLPHLRTEAKEGVGRLRERLDPDDQMLLVLRLDRKMEWADVATVMLGAEADEDRARASAAVRKRFERVKTRLRALAVEAGLVDAR